MLSILFLCIFVLFQYQLKLLAREMGEIRSRQTNAVPTRTIALPQPFSPFHWRIINREKDLYSTALVDLAGISEKLKPLEGKIPYIELVSAYRSIANAEWEEHTLLGDSAGRKETGHNQCPEKRHRHQPR